MFKTTIYISTINCENTGENCMYMEAKICCSDTDKKWPKFDLWLCVSEDGLGIYEDRPLQTEEPKPLKYFDFYAGARIDTDPDATLPPRQRHLLKNGYDYDFGSFTYVGCALVNMFNIYAENFFTGFKTDVNILDVMKEL